LIAPQIDRFPSHRNAPMDKQVSNVTLAEGKSEDHPEGIANDIRRKPLPLLTRSGLADDPDCCSGRVNFSEQL
jgi:hypothetical protein